MKDACSVLEQCWLVLALVQCWWSWLWWWQWHLRTVKCCIVRSVHLSHICDVHVYLAFWKCFETYINIHDYICTHIPIHLYNIMEVNTTDSKAIWRQHQGQSSSSGCVNSSHSAVKQKKRNRGLLKFLLRQLGIILVKFRVFFFLPCVFCTSKWYFYWCRSFSWPHDCLVSRCLTQAGRSCTASPTSTQGNGLMA